MTKLPANAHVHCLGIGGFGINPIARVMRDMGYTITGCDMAESPLVGPLRDSGVAFLLGHDPAHLDTFRPDALLISSAVTPDNPEVVAAQGRGIPVYKRSDILGELMADRMGIAVAGTHGKTTTTSMISSMLTGCGQDPTFIIGGVSKDLGTNARAGGGTAFVIEADEYDRMFMGLKPRIIVLTSLEMDHPDMFEDLAAVRALFTEFVDLLPEDGLLIGCTDSKEVAKLVDRRLEQGRPAIGYGENFAAEWITLGIQANEAGGSDFLASFRKPEDDGAFIMGSISVSLRLPGDHNALNATAALAVADTLGLDLRKAADALGEFSGTGRRFEVKGEAGGVTVIDDYAHHPTAIAATLKAARSRYGGRPIWAVWQPHTYRRTRALLDEFAACFGDADHVIITDVYKSRDTHDYGVSVQDVLDRMRHPDARHIGALDDVTGYLLAHIQPGGVVIVMSAGDATKIGEGVLGILSNAKDRFRMTYRIPSTTTLVPEIGNIDFNYVSIGLLSKVLNSTQEYGDETQRAQELVSALLTATAQNHEFTRQEILSLSDESLVTILETIKVVPRFKDVLDKTDAAKPLFARIYDAILLGQAQFWSDIGEMVRPASLGLSMYIDTGSVSRLAGLDALTGSITKSIPKLTGLDTLAGSFAESVSSMTGLTSWASSYSKSICELAGLNTLAGSYANMISEIAGLSELAGLVDASSQSLTEQIRPLASKIGDYVASTGMALKLNSEMQSALAQLRPTGLDQIQGALGTWANQMSKLALPEPFLTSSLVASEVNAPKIHSLDYSYLPAPALDTLDDLDMARDSFDKQRMRDSYDVLMNLELNVRRLIVDRLNALGDEKWWKRRVPDGVRNDANKLKAEDKALTADEHHPIDYTYIGGLKEIIVRNDNWNEIFKEFFENKPIVEVGLDHCSRIRSQVMHFRPISDTDYHLLLGNAQLIVRLMERASKG